jgi:hypothetical protein
MISSGKSPRQRVQFDSDDETRRQFESSIETRARIWTKEDGMLTEADGSIFGCDVDVDVVLKIRK